MCECVVAGPDDGEGGASGVVWTLPMKIKCEKWMCWNDWEFNGTAPTFIFMANVIISKLEKMNGINGKKTTNIIYIHTHMGNWKNMLTQQYEIYNGKKNKKMSWKWK